MADYRISELPDNLPPGKYPTRVKNAYWEGKELVIELVYSPETTLTDSLITFTVEEKGK